jgi:TRAP-type uncharacterized transport system fused permease subunit
MRGMPAEELPAVRDVLLEGWHFLLPLVALVWLLVAGYSPMRVGFYAILAVMAAAGLRAVLDLSPLRADLAGFVALCRRAWR